MPTAYSILAGREVDTSSEAWRHECECRWLLDEKPTRSQKHLYLYGVVDRQSLMVLDHKTGQHVLRDGYSSLWQHKFPLMKARSLAAADHILAEAKRLYDISKK